MSNEIVIRLIVPDGVRVAGVEQGDSGSRPQSGRRQTPAQETPVHDEDWPQDQDAPADDPWNQPEQESSSQPASTGGKLFPKSGTYTVDAKNGRRLWTFGKPNAETCHCGYPAAYVEGQTGSRKWAAWWCPVKYNNERFREACDFQAWATKK